MTVCKDICRDYYYFPNNPFDKKSATRYLGLNIFYNHPLLFQHNILIYFLVFIKNSKL